MNRSDIQIPVIFIGGAGRSGSTLLDLILGNVSSAVSVGEVKHFFEYYGGANHLRCGCGEPLQRCPFWQEVVHHAGFTQDEIAFLARQSAYNRTRFFGVQIGNIQEAKRALSEAYGRLYHAILQVGRVKVIVDSSKSPTHLEILLQNPQMKVSLLHLLRHPLAVAYSWARRPKRDPASGQSMPQRTWLDAVFRWHVENTRVHALAGKISRVAFVKFEAFTAAPYLELSKALARLKWEYALAEVEDLLAQRRPLYPVHSVGGNPVRFAFPAYLVIHPSNEWREHFPRMMIHAFDWLYKYWTTRWAL